MVRTLLIPTLLASTLFLAAPLFAQENTGLPIRAILDRAQGARQSAQDAQDARLIELQADTRAQIQVATSSRERIDAIRSFVGERTDMARDRAATAGDVRRDVRAAAQWHGGLIRERFVVAIRQFDSLITRIESRIAKLQAAGIATASVEAELDVAQAAVVTAKANVQAVANFVAGIDETSDRATTRTELLTHIRTAQSSVRAAHQALIQAVRALAALQPRTNATRATTTVDIEATTTSQ